MTRFLKITLLFAMLAAAGPVFAQQDLSGPWQGKLAVDAKTSLTIQFTFLKKPDGSYSAVLDSPDNPAIKNVAASAVSYSAGALKVDVASLSGSYAGTLKDGKFEGKWTQPGGTLPLELSAYQKPVLSKAAMDTLAGAWHGPITAPGVSLTFVARFKRNDKGEFTGSLFVPEQGVELPMSDIQFADNKLDFKVAPVRGEMVADYVNGGFNGLWRQGGNPPAGLPVSLKKGDVAAVVFPLKLSAESFASLAGRWSGSLATPQATLNVALRFEVNATGQYVGYIELPGGPAKGLPIGEADLTAGKLSVKAAGVPGEYQGTLSGKTLTGQWIGQGPQGPVPTPLTLTRQ
ncbi:MAG TPA: hypothetical protein VK700_05655 [Steroidobacteraceae bacterium]|jgi:hypothetical protein|nr:hypothetical protein [Steroidobacteraceae bacterium]